MATYNIGPVKTVIPSSLVTTPASLTYVPDTSKTRWAILSPVSVLSSSVDNGSDCEPQRPTSGIVFP